MLIAFVALIIRNRIYTKLKDAEDEMVERPNYMNVPASIRELEKIEMIRQADNAADGRTLSEIREYGFQISSFQDPQHGSGTRADPGNVLPCTIIGKGRIFRKIEYHHVVVCDREESVD